MSQDTAGRGASRPEAELEGAHPRPASAVPFFLGIALLALFVSTAGQRVTGALIYDREAILAGEVWRILSGQLVHLGVSHLLLDLAGLGLVWLAVGPRFTAGEWSSCLVLVSAGVGLGMVMLSPAVRYGAGLSGALHGLFAAGTLAEIAAGRRAAWALLVVLVAKLLSEQIAGPLTGSMLGDRTGIEAHVYGALSGVLAFALLSLRRKNAR